MVRSEPPSISVSRRGSATGEADCTVVWVRGEHDIATRVSLVVVIARAAQRNDADLVVDLSRVTFMDASTIGAIVGSRNRLRSQGRSLHVRAPSPAAARVLELCGLGSLVQPSRVEAVHPSGVAAALGTWVHVRPIQPGRAAGGDRARATALPATGAPQRALATADVRVEKAATTDDVDGGSP